jgi:mono/diheme cytochrome c family protein
MTRRPPRLTVMLLLTACSRDYAPEQTASGEQIYQKACRECHQPAANGSIFILKAQHSNTAYISEKVYQGSWLMPAFPRFTVNDLRKISLYTLEHSDTAE